MKIVLYLNTGERERLNKSSYLSLLFELDGYLRAPSSIINPSVVVELPTINPEEIVNEDNELLADEDNIEIVSDIERVTNANYMYIPEFGRYYYITDIVVLKTHEFMISASVDVLMSNREYILSQRCYIERNEFEFDVSLQDELLPLAFTKRITESKPTRGSLVNVEMGTPGALNVIATFVTDQAKMLNISLHTISAPSGSGLESFDPERYVSYSTFLPFVMTPQSVAELGIKILQDDTIASFVRSVVALPIGRAHV